MSIPVSRMAAIASGRTVPGSVPALSTSKDSPASWRRSPSAIWLRAELPVQRIRTRVFKRCLAAVLEPVLGAIAGRADRQHHRDFHQNADYRGQGGTGIGTEQSNGCRNRQLEKFGRADQS